MLSGQDAHVDAHHAVFQRFGHAENAAHVAAVEVAGQAELGVVGCVHRFLFGLELEDGRKRAKSLFFRAQHVGRGIGHHGGLKELARAHAGQALAPNHHAAAFGHGVVHMALHFGQGCLFDQGALVHAVFKAIAHFGTLNFGSELFDKFVVHTFLHIKAVGAHTGLACVAVFAGEGAFDRAVDVGVFKHDEGRVATQLQRHFLDGGRGLRHQDTAHFGGACKADVPHHVAGAQHLAHGNRIVCVGGDHVEHARRNARADGQLGRGQGRQRRELGRFDDDRAACGQGWCDFARDHGQREVPRRDGRADPDGLLEHEQAAVVVELGQGLAVDALGLLSEPLDKACAISDFAFGLGQGLALLGGHDAAQIVLVGHQQVVPLAQDDAALFGGFGFPGGPCCVGCGNGLLGLGRAEVGHIGQVLARGGVGHGKTAAAFDPLAIDQGVGLEQARVVELGEGGCLHVHGGLQKLQVQVLFVFNRQA